MEKTMTALMDMTAEQIAAMMQGWGEPAYRAKQLRLWLEHGVYPRDMTNFPLTLRARLEEKPWGGAVIRETYVSKIDDTKKYLFQFDDKELVEGVLMRYHHGNTLCLSTQVGCRMGCAFCASTLDGLKRNITHGEMIGMLAAVESSEQAAKGARAVTNIVLMGSGEPLDNFENVVLFLKRVTDEAGLNFSPRNISLSTAGLVDGIYRLIEEAPRVTLCISLHAHSDEVRARIMPVNKKYHLAEVLKAAGMYAKKTGRRVIFEYALIEGVNASLSDADALSARLKGLLCHVNLIPLNSVKESALQGVTRSAAQIFTDRLNKNGISATVRREMGTDIEGACGQLRRRVLEAE